MKLIAVSSMADRPEVDCLILPFYQTSKKAEPAFSSNHFDEWIQPVLATLDFKAKSEEATIIYTKDKKNKRLILLGLGEKKKISPEGIRRAMACAIKLSKQKKCTTVALVCAEMGHIPEWVEGALLSNYSFNLYKHDKKDELSDCLQALCLIGISQKQLQECRQIEMVCEAVNFARDLVNGNADDINAQKLVQVAQKMAQTNPSFKTTVLGKKELIKHGLGLLLAVNRASSKDPALILIEYNGKPSSKQKTALVGKGITYDTGGLLLKPRGSMETMKDDMSGAAAVLGTLKAAADLKLPVNLIGVIPATENGIGPDSYKPGDVYQSHSGKTVEISDTDAEGRLVLADAISYVQKHYTPTQIIDLATLTGGIIVALGEHATGLFSNDDALADRLYEAGEATQERVWRMPLYDDYKDCLKSSIADLKNSAGRSASSISGALFIQEFVKEIPWAHLDIAGTAYLTTPRHYHPTHATGVGVRLLVRFLLDQK